MADLLLAGGYDAVHVGAYGMHAADSDFSAILAAQEAACTSFIPFRDPNLLVAHDYINIPLSALPVLE